MRVLETVRLMDDASRRRAKLESELDHLREQILVADAAYENATTQASHDAADTECQRLRKQLRALRTQLRELNADSGGLRPKGRAKAQTAGE